MNDDSARPPTGPTNLLLQTGEDADCDESACMDLLGVEDPADVDVLFVTFTRSADDRLAALKRHADAPPAKVGVVSVQVGGSNGGDRLGGSGGPTVRRISDPSDLTGVGIAISEFLSAWSGDGNRTVVCFESLTALLQYVDASRVFQFCNEITSKFEAAGATAHFHITPEAHERQELSVLSSLFDGRVSAAGMGDGPDAGAAGTGDTAEAAGSTGAAGSGAAGAPAADGSTVEPDDTTDDAPNDPPEPGTGPGEADPFEYVGGGESPTPDSADPADDADGADPAGDAGAPPDTDPADLVTSVIADDGDADDIGGDATDGDATDDSDEAPDGPDPDAALSEGEAPGDDESPAADDARPAATSRRTEREEMRRRLEYVGPNATSPGGVAAGAAGDGGGDGGDPGPADDGDDATDRSEKYAFYQRTTATVVGVVVMLVLISFLSAAMPVPVGTDAPAEGADVTPTATPEAVAATDAATATEDAATTSATATATATTTATPTATATATPDDSTDSTSGTSSGTSDDGSTTDPTPTATPEQTTTPTSTPTDTPSDDDGDLISDTLDTDDDGDLL